MIEDLRVENLSILKVAICSKLTNIGFTNPNIISVIGFISSLEINTGNDQQLKFRLKSFLGCIGQIENKNLFVYLGGENVTPLTLATETNLKKSSLIFSLCLALFPNAPFFNSSCIFPDDLLRQLHVEEEFPNKVESLLKLFIADNYTELKIGKFVCDGNACYLPIILPEVTPSDSIATLSDYRVRFPNRSSLPYINFPIFKFNYIFQYLRFSEHAIDQILLKREAFRAFEKGRKDPYLVEQILFMSKTVDQIKLDSELGVVKKTEQAARNFNFALEVFGFIEAMTDQSKSQLNGEILERDKSLNELKQHLILNLTLRELQELLQKFEALSKLMENAPLLSIFTSDGTDYATPIFLLSRKPPINSLLGLVFKLDDDFRRCLKSPLIYDPTRLNNAINKLSSKKSLS